MWYQSSAVFFVDALPRQTEKFWIYLGILLPTYLAPEFRWLNPKNQNFEKLKKILGDNVLLYIYVYNKWRSYDIWFLKYKAQQTQFLVILGHFLPFHPSDQLENQNFEKLKKNPHTPRDIIILQMCTFEDPWCSHNKRVCCMPNVPPSGI